MKSCAVRRCPLSCRRQWREVKPECHGERSEAVLVVLKIASLFALLAMSNIPTYNFLPLPADGEGKGGGALGTAGDDEISTNSAHELVYFLILTRCPLAARTASALFLHPRKLFLAFY
jgi:hypothetical protein